MEEEVSVEGATGGPYMVEKIVGIYIGKDLKKYFRVKWIDTWEREEVLSESCQALIDEFWAGTNLDSQGNEVKRTDVKLGEKIVKKELLSSLSENSKTFPELPKKYTDNEKLNESKLPGSEKTTSEATKLHQSSIPDLVSPSSKPAIADSSLAKESILPKRPSSVPLPSSSSSSHSSDRKRVSLSPERSQKALKQQPMLKRSSSKDDVMSSPSIFGNTLKTSLQSDNSKKSVSQGTNTLKDDNLEIKKTPKKKLKTGTVDTTKVSKNTTISKMQSATTQTDDVVDYDPPFIDHNGVIYSTPPRQGSFENYSSDDCLPDSLVVNQNEDSNELSDIDMEGISDVDLSDDDDELEITVSIESPHQQKKRANILNKQSITPSRRGRPPKQNNNNSISNRNKSNELSARNNSVQNMSSTSSFLHPRHFLSNNNGSNNFNQRNMSRSRIPQNQPVAYQGSNNQLQSPQQKSYDKQFTNSYNSNLPRNNRFNSQSHISNNASQSSQMNSNQHSPIENNVQRSVVLRDRTCSICSQTFENLTLARQHVKAVHSSPSNTATMKCVTCGDVFSNKQLYESHIASHKRQINHSHKCTMCSKTFKRKSELNQHILVHRNEYPFSCNICSMRFRQQSQLVTHKGRRHATNNQGTYTCSHCGMGFTSYSRFSAHMRQHDSGLPFKCNICNERFQAENELLVHLGHHNNGPCFTCHICKKAFKTKAYLFGHMQMHKEYIPSTPNKSTNVQQNSLPQNSTPSSQNQQTGRNNHDSFESPAVTKIKIQED